MRRSQADSTNRSLAAFGKLQHILLVARGVDGVRLILKHVAVCLCFIVAVACGGGGSSTPTAPTPTPEPAPAPDLVVVSPTVNDSSLAVGATFTLSVSNSL